MADFRPTLPTAPRDYNQADEQASRRDIELRLSALEDRLNNAGLGTVSDDVVTIPTQITATSDGLTTGLIPKGAGFIEVTASNADHIITLPAGDIRQQIWGYVGANGCEMRTPASSNATINGVDSDGTNEAAIPATTLFLATCTATDTWILLAWDEGGDDIAGITPDAA